MTLQDLGLEEKRSAALRRYLRVWYACFKLAGILLLAAVAILHLAIVTIRFDELPTVAGHPIQIDLVLRDYFLFSYLAITALSLFYAIWCWIKDASQRPFLYFAITILILMFIIQVICLYKELIGTMISHTPIAAHQ